MRISVDGATFGYDERGRAGAPAVVLLHAFALSRAIWRDLLDPLAADGARVVALDLRGMGESDAPGGPYLTEALAGDVAGVLDGLGIERATIVGHSYSVGVAYEFFRMYAERTAAFVAVQQSTRPLDDDARRVFETLADTIERDGATALAPFTGRYVGATTARARPELLGAVRALLVANDPRGAAATLRGVGHRMDLGDLLADVDVPFLAIAGSEDVLCSRESMAADVARVRGGELATLACGHVPQLEAPAETLAALRRFLANVPR